MEYFLAQKVLQLLLIVVVVGGTGGSYVTCGGALSIYGRSDEAIASNCWICDYTGSGSYYVNIRCLKCGCTSSQPRCVNHAFTSGGAGQCNQKSWSSCSICHGKDSSKEEFVPCNTHGIKGPHSYCVHDGSFYYDIHD